MRGKFCLIFTFRLLQENFVRLEVAASGNEKTSIDCVNASCPSIVEPCIHIHYKPFQRAVCADLAKECATV